jgi:hypothetical protein
MLTLGVVMMIEGKKADQNYKKGFTQGDHAHGHLHLDIILFL